MEHGSDSGMATVNARMQPRQNIEPSWSALVIFRSVPVQEGSSVCYYNTRNGSRRRAVCCLRRAVAFRVAGVGWQQALAPLHRLQQLVAHLPERRKQPVPQRAL